MFVRVSSSGGSISNDCPPMGLWYSSLCWGLGGASSVMSASSGISPGFSGSGLSSSGFSGSGFSISGLSSSSTWLLSSLLL